jgi:hypothetical protein
LKFGGAGNGLLAIALQNSSTIFRHAVRATQGARACFGFGLIKTKDTMRVILF